MPLLPGYSSSGFPTENLECLLGSFIPDGPGTLVFILQPCKTPRDLNRSSGSRLPIVDQQRSQKQKWYLSGLPLCASLLPKVPQIFAASHTDRNLRYFVQISSYFQQGQWHQAILLCLEVEDLKSFLFKIEYRDPPSQWWFGLQTNMNSNV